MNFFDNLQNKIVSFGSKSKFMSWLSIKIYGYNVFEGYNHLFLDVIPK